MDENKATTALVLSGITIVVMTAVIASQNKKIKLYQNHNQKLQNWTKLAQRLLMEQNMAIPDGLMVPEKLLIDLTAYNLLRENNLE